MKKGDFTNLADNYTKYRPSYNKEIVNLVLSSVEKNVSAIKAADIGAGTGIFTKSLIDGGIKDPVAVEPNVAMRNAGVKFLDHRIDFLDGSAENTGLRSNHFDLVTMASSFHWANTSDAINEFNRILCLGGVFSALWNPRLTERSVIESEVQDLLSKKYKVSSRVSSGLSGVTIDLRETLSNCGFFRSVVYVDAIDVVIRSQEEYVGAWRSVNDIQTQLGPDKFSEFIDDVVRITSKYPCVEVHYLTRAWIASK